MIYQCSCVGECMHGWVGGVRGWLNTSQVGVGLVGTSASLSWLEPLAVRCWHAVWTHQVCRHTLPARFAALCVSVCVDACACVIIFRDSVTDNPLHLSTYAFSSLTNPWAKLQAVYLCISLTGQPDSPSLSNTRMHAHGDSIIRTQPTNNAICVGNPYVTFLTVREAWDDSTRACTRHIHQHMQNSSSSLLYNLYKKTQGHWSKRNIGS